MINSMSASSPASNKKYCGECGQSTIQACPNCNSSIRGYYHVDGVVSFSDTPVPRFCTDCGKPYPWISKAIDAAECLISELSELTDEEKEILKKNLDDIINETPYTSLAVTRFKKLIPKSGKVAGELIKDILIKIVSEAAKKALWDDKP